MELGYNNIKEERKVSSYFERHLDLVIEKEWIKQDYEIILNLLLNKKVNCINDIVNYLPNKQLDSIVCIIRNLKLKGVKLQVKATCDNCGKIYYKALSRYNNTNYNLCCRNCNNEWFSKVISKTKDFSDKMKINAVNMLSEGKFSHVETSIQIIVNNILDNMNIENENEYNCKYVSIDNAIHLDNNKILFIECNGGFWHTDTRLYDEINYEIQKNRIKMDKIKHTFIKNNYDIEILYLWEIDILNDIDLCKNLIKKYIKNDGELENYHSFNYSNEDNKLQLDKENIIIPYMEFKIEDLNKITDLSVKERKEFWTTFKCDNCGKESKQLTKQYNKNKHHLCSDDCKHEFKKNTIKLPNCECEYCKKEIYVYPSKLKRTKVNFCNTDCYLKYVKKEEVTFNCEYCGKEKTIRKSDYDKNIHHFCNQECNIKYRNKKIVS